ncbi:MAG TPA: LamG-like jellyroll fold domain-containing protein [Planctomycetota bacterium]|nr:LamG-like jellyroll fold domain-containing protein [Planctomycetota bacterium]
MPVVAALECACGIAPEAPHDAFLRWQSPSIPGPFQVEVRRDDQVIAVLDGDSGAPQTFRDNDVPPGVHVYEIVVLVLDERSDSVFCEVNCPPPGEPLPVARIAGPSSLVLPPARVIEATYDGRESTDSRGTRALRYMWTALAAPSVQVEVLSPSTAVTRLRIQVGAGADLLVPVMINLHVLETAQGGASASASAILGLLGDEPIGPPRFVRPPRDLLVAVAGRPFELPILLAEGIPWPFPAPLDAPEGLEVDPNLGRLIWVPRIEDAGRSHPLMLLAANASGEAVLNLSIEVLEPGHPLALYAFPLPDTQGQGGGATLEPAPSTIPDQSVTSPALDLHLSFLAAEETCAVQLVRAGGGDPLDGLLFSPGCAGPPVSASGVYLSGSAGTKLTDFITNDFTIEVWLSSVSPALPPGGSGYIFSMSRGTAESNWLIAHVGADSYSASVNLGDPPAFGAGDEGRGAGAPDEISFTAAPRGDGLTNIVFVRRGNTHSVHVNGSLVNSIEVPAVNLIAGWDPNYGITLGNSDDESSPFAGRIHLTAVYGEALGDGMIRYLDDLGPRIPSTGEIPRPIADICPDPREIRRGVQADGSLSRSVAGGGGGGGGAGRGAGDGRGAGNGDGCPEMLLPFRWELTASDGRALSQAPVPGEEDCRRIIDVSYDATPAVRFDLSLSLTVTQVPVRGVVVSSLPAVKTIRLPTHFLRGDSNLDGEMDLSDGVNILLRLFLSMTPLACADAADSNDDGSVNLSDALYIFRFLFTGGPAPPEPFPLCGPDPTDDSPLAPVPGDLGCVEPNPHCPP